MGKARRRVGSTVARKGSSLDNGVDTARKPYAIEHILQFEKGGMTLKDIGIYYGVSKQAISQKIKTFEKELNLPDKEIVSAYGRFRSDILQGAEATFLTAALDPEKIKKASARDCMVNYGITVDKRRLYLGESTQNIALHVLVEAMERRRRGLKPAVEPGSDGASEHE